MSTIMKRAGGATPSRRSAVERPPLRMFEVDQPRCEATAWAAACEPSSVR